jgi:hypothetical protein
VRYSFEHHTGTLRLKLSAPQLPDDAPSSAGAASVSHGRHRQIGATRDWPRSTRGPRSWIFGGRSAGWTSTVAGGAVLHHPSPDRYSARHRRLPHRRRGIRYARPPARLQRFREAEVIGDVRRCRRRGPPPPPAPCAKVRSGLQTTTDRRPPVRPAAPRGCRSPIGSGLGLINPFSIRTIKRRLSVPVIVDAGKKRAPHPTHASPWSRADGILMNTPPPRRRIRWHGARDGPLRWRAAWPIWPADAARETAARPHPWNAGIGNCVAAGGSRPRVPEPTSRLRRVGKAGARGCRVRSP